MSFTDTLLTDIEKVKKEKDFGITINKLRSSKTLGIWGTGLAGTMIYEQLRNLGIEVQFFLDNDKNKIGTALYGIEVRRITDIPSDSLVIIAANVMYHIHEQLKASSIDYIYIDPVWFHFLDKNSDVPNVYRINQEHIDDVYNMLEDDMSRKVLRNVLLHRAVHDISLIWEVYDEHQYFANDVVKKAEGCFVDGGAFQGDTLKTFLMQIESSNYRYFAFEADNHNYELLRNYCREHMLQSVYPINLAMWSRKECLYFESNDVTGDVSGKVIENKKSGSVVEIMADSIDNVLPEENINFIKMDIEGAEINALNGARASIVKCKPILAISAYHELEHLWEIPILIKEINKDYKIYFRHHMWNMADTVCYGKIR